MSARSLRLAAARLAAALFIVVAAAPAHAHERAYRQVLDAQGNVTAYDVAQDARGFLWLGTAAGLARYDGIDAVPIRPDVIARVVEHVWIAPDDAVLVDEQAGGLIEVRGDDARELHDEAGEPLVRVSDVAFDVAGGTWVAAKGRLYRRVGDTLVAEAETLLEGERAHLLVAAPGGGVLVTTGAGLWRVHADGHAERRLTLAGISVILLAGDGTDDEIWLAHGAVIERRRGATVVFSADLRAQVKDARVTDLARRGHTLWVCLGRALLAIRDDAVEIVPIDPSFSVGARRLLVDAEGSLWVASYRGLLHFPEPDTVIWNVASGLPRGGGRFLARGAEGVWVTTWYGAARVDDARTARAVEAVPEEDFLAREQVCADGWGVTWLAPPGQLVARRAGRFERYPTPHPGGSSRCGRAADGTLWWLKAVNLIRTGPPARPEPTLLPHPWGTRVVSPIAVLEDSRGRLWLAIDEETCHTDARELTGWTCVRTPGREGAVVASLAETPAGDIWLAVRGEGVFRWNDDHWQLIESSRQLPSRWVIRLRPSRSGGMWVVGQGMVLHVTADAAATSWHVIEHLSFWHGLSHPGATDVIEDEDGRLWLSGGYVALVEVPPEARFAEVPPPRVELVRARVDGAEVTPAQAAALPPGVGRVELEFRALTYREPQRLRYRTRLGGSHSTPGTDGRFTFVAPGAGDHRLEVEASVDGERWSPAASYVFSVATPWYRRSWAWLGFALLLGGALYAAHAARVAVLLRLERQRARIARDLHDEVGSGLGSIGILSELLGGDELPDEERRHVAERVRGTATALSESLRDIVWALRAGSESLAALPEYLDERGASLFTGRARFQVVADPVPPSLRIALPVRRHVQLLALEALHNAARHSGARAVVLGLEEISASGWHLWVEDDGCGVERGPRGGGGLGLESMRRRAAALRGELRVGGRPGGGTRVDLWFDLEGRPARAPEKPAAPAGAARELSRS